MRGDLDWIVMKTLEKDRSRRYDTANGLAMDLKRFLENEPVFARPPTSAYRLQKLVRRHKVAFAAISSVVFALALGFGISTRLFVRERAARNELLAGATIDRADLLLSQDNLVEAESLYRQGLELQKRLNNRNPQIVITLCKTLTSLLNQGKVSEVEPMAWEALARAKAIEADRRPDISQTLRYYFAELCSRGEYQEADRLVSEIQPPSHKPESRDAGLISLRGHFLGWRGRWKEATSSLSEAVALNPEDDYSHLLLASALVQVGDVATYRRFCVEELARFAETTDPKVAERMAKICLLLPPPKSDLEQINRWADLAVNANTNHSLWNWFACTKGLADFRSGHFQEAAERMDRVLHAPGNYDLWIEAFAVLAMAQAKLNRFEEAHTTLAKVNGIADQNLPKADSGDLGWGWNDWVTDWLLLREARALIDPTSAATSP
jgi:tetratricopeptide (TPR) repeat protein